MPRPLRPEDAEAVAALIRQSFAALPQPVDPPPSALHETGQSIAAALAEGGGAGIEREGRLCACVLWKPKQCGLYLGRLAVAPQARGHGYARALIAAGEAEARARGLSRLLISTRLAMQANRRLFAACGFTETAFHAHPGYSEPTFVDMEKPLAGSGA